MSLVVCRFKSPTQIQSVLGNRVLQDIMIKRAGKFWLVAWGKVKHLLNLDEVTEIGARCEGMWFRDRTSAINLYRSNWGRLQAIELFADHCSDPQMPQLGSRAKTKRLFRP